MSATQNTDLWKLFNDKYAFLNTFVEKAAEEIDNNKKSDQSAGHSQYYYHLRMLSRNILSSISEKLNDSSNKLSEERTIYISKTIKNAEIEPILPIFKQMGIDLVQHPTWNTTVIVTITKDICTFVQQKA